MRTVLVNAGAGLLLGVVIALAGCKQAEQPSPKTPPPPATQPGDETAAAEQTLCPVSGDPMDKNVFVVHQGKKVYFCCPGCKGVFLSKPEKYLPKLPQFGGKEEPATKPAA